MEAQDVILQNKGMYQDSSISKSSNEFAFENYGIRITGELDNTLLSVTNEKGPIRTHNIEGTYLGKAVLGKYLIVFTTGTEYDYIYRIIEKHGYGVLRTNRNKYYFPYQKEQIINRVLKLYLGMNQMIFKKYIG